MYKVICLSLPWRPIVLRRVWKSQHHVVPPVVALNYCNGVRSESIARPKRVLPQTNNNNLGLETTYSIPSKYLMVTSSLPGNTKYEDITTGLSQLLKSSKTSTIAVQFPAIVILTTPTFATWLENQPFMSKIVELIFASSKAKSMQGFEVTALLAVVDGLPVGSQRSLRSGFQSREGFAILACNHKQNLPGVWQGDRVNTKDQHGKPSIIFSIPSKSTDEEVLEIGLPLANTMFRNGRITTMLVSRWRKSHAAGLFEKIEQIEKHSALVHPAPAPAAVALDWNIPAVPLTPPRQVVSGLGNIVRQVMSAEGSVVPASQELEASVDAYLEARKVPKQTVSVWALVVPDSMMKKVEGERRLETDAKTIKASWKGNLSPNILRDVGHCLRYGQGASLHRVLSGGGGWGHKQGLLSLDPETTLEQSPDARYDFDSAHPSENEQVQALGNIAKPDSWIQFYISTALITDEAARDSGLETPDHGLGRLNSLAFGCIPSTVDSLPAPTSDPSGPLDKTAPHALIEGFKGHFGAQSEAGIFIHAPGNDKIKSSKVDIPYSTLRWAIADDDKSNKID